MSNIQDKALDTQAHAETAKNAGRTFQSNIVSNSVGLAAVAILGIIAQLFFPWWSIAVVGFGVGFWLADTPARSSFYGFTAMFAVWCAYAGYQSLANGGLMTNTVSSMLGGTVSGTQMIFVTGTIGGTITGLAAVAGTQLRELLKDKGIMK